MLSGLPGQAQGSLHQVVLSMGGTWYSGDAGSLNLGFVSRILDFSTKVARLTSVSVSGVSPTPHFSCLVKIKIGWEILYEESSVLKDPPPLPPLTSSPTR